MLVSYGPLILNKLEMTQRRAARFAMNNVDKYASVTNMLVQECLGWPTLEQRCKELRIIIFFKLLIGW